MIIRHRWESFFFYYLPGKKWDKQKGWLKIKEKKKKIEKERSRLRKIDRQVRKCLFTYLKKKLQEREKRWFKKGKERRKKRNWNGRDKK